MIVNYHYKCRNCGVIFYARNAVKIADAQEQLLKITTHSTVNAMSDLITHDCHPVKPNEYGIADLIGIRP